MLRSRGEGAWQHVFNLKGRCSTRSGRLEVHSDPGFSGFRPGFSTAKGAFLLQVLVNGHDAGHYGPAFEEWIVFFQGESQWNWKNGSRDGRSGCRPLL